MKKISQKLFIFAKEYAIIKIQRESFSVTTQERKALV